MTEDPEDKRPPALVFGEGAKLQAKGPFLGLLAEFERHLASPTQLVVIGYSFRDIHVNEVIRRWTAQDTSRTILVVDPEWPERFPNPKDFRRELNAYLIPRTRQRSCARANCRPSRRFNRESTYGRSSAPKRSRVSIPAKPSKRLIEWADDEFSERIRNDVGKAPGIDA